MRSTIGGRMALLLMLALLPPSTATAAPGGEVPVRAARVTRGTMTDTETFLGSLVPLYDATVAAQVAGTITTAFVRSGQQVKQGDPLFQFDDRAARADVEISQAHLRVAAGALHRAQELLRSGNMPQSRLDELNSDYATATAQLTAAQVRLEVLTLRAPFDARAGLVRHSAGTFVQMGEALVQLTDDTRLAVDFRLPQSHLQQVSLGQRFTVSSRALGAGRTLEGHITVISPQADRNSRAVDVRGDVATTGGRPIVSGIAVRVDLTVAERVGQLLVPAEALIPGLLTDQAYRIEQGLARLVQVRTGTRRDGQVEVLSGLAEGDLVVTLGQFRIRDGDGVQVVPEGQPSAVPATVGGR